MPNTLDVDLLPYLEDITDICVGNKTLGDVGAGELTTLPEILSLICCDQTNREYTKQGLKKIRLIEDKIIFLRRQLEMLQRMQDFELEKKK